jgi:hypothetical protein
MDLENCKLDFMILQTNLALACIDFIGIMNQVHYIDNQFKFELSNNFTTCYELFHDLVPIFTTAQNQYHELYNIISQRTVHHV